MSTSSLTLAQELQNFMHAPNNTDSLMILKEDEQWFEWHHNVILQARLHRAFRILDLTFDPSNLVPGDDRRLWIEQENYMNLLFQKHLKTTAAITIRDFLGCVDQPREVWKGLLAFYQTSSTSYDRAAVYETRLHMLRPSQFPNCLEFILEFMKTVTEHDQCALHPYTSATKIMKLNLAFASDPEL